MQKVLHEFDLMIFVCTRPEKCVFTCSPRPQDKVLTNQRFYLHAPRHQNLPSSLLTTTSSPAGIPSQKNSSRATSETSPLNIASPSPSNIYPLPFLLNIHPSSQSIHQSPCASLSNQSDDESSPTPPPTLTSALAAIQNVELRKRLAFWHLS